MQAEPCPKCGRNLNLVGFAHDCRPFMANNMANAHVVANSVANTVSDGMANKLSVTYRYRDKEKRQRYQRDLMRRRRSNSLQSTHSVKSSQA